MAKLPITNNESIRKRVATTFKKPSLTKQEYADQTDVNQILNKFKLTGELPVRHEGIYADVSHIPDYAQIILQAEEARSFFLSLPAQTRAKFNNDPGLLLEWASDPRNQAEAVSLGVIQAPPKTPTEVPAEIKKEPENLTKHAEK